MAITVQNWVAVDNELLNIFIIIRKDSKFLVISYYNIKVKRYCPQGGGRGYAPPFIVLRSIVNVYGMYYLR